MAKPISPLEPRFWSKVEKRRPDQCWFWKASIDVNGYGQFGICAGQLGRKTPTMAKAHRVAWIITHGEIPPGMYLCHTCDMPRCVNPAHLFLGTQTDNMRDCVEKNRHGFGRMGQPIYYDVKRLRKIFAAYQSGMSIKEIGARHEISRGYLHRILKRHKIPLRGAGYRKLKATEVQQIRLLFAQGHITRAQLAERFGVTHSNICFILSGEIWPDPEAPIAPRRQRVKITEDQANEIRQSHASGKMTQTQLAAHYGVAYSTINYNIHYREL